MNHDANETCQTQGCEMFGVTLMGLEGIPADIPVQCGVCGAPVAAPDRAPK